METVFKTFRAEFKGIDEDGSLNMFIPVSSGKTDRDGEIVEPQAFKKTLKEFMKHPVLVASHDYRDLTNQIGEWTKLKITDEGIEGKPKYYVNAGNEQADWAYYLASNGKAAYSIGFMPKVWDDGDGVKEPRRTYKEIELLEISQVIIPSNRDAIQSMRSKSVDPIINEICDEIEEELPEITKEIITKPEETDDFIRIPVRSCEVTATIDISKKEGISALYCGKEKQVRTYLFRKDHDWTMAKAKAWVKEHEGKSAHEISQEEIIDEIDYLTTLIKENGMNEDVKESALEFAQKTIVQLKEEIPEDNASVMLAIGAKSLGYGVPIASYTIGKDGKPVKGLDLRRPGSDIPVKDIATVKLEIKDLPEIKETLNQANQIIDDERIRLIVEQVVKQVVKNS